LNEGAGSLTGGQAATRVIGYTHTRGVRAQSVAAEFLDLGTGWKRREASGAGSDETEEKIGVLIEETQSDVDLGTVHRSRRKWTAVAMVMRTRCTHFLRL
jgi:hypothetical protein